MAGEERERKVGKNNRKKTKGVESKGRLERKGKGEVEECAERSEGSKHLRDKREMGIAHSHKDVFYTEIQKLD